MWHGEEPFLAFERNNLTPRRHVDMFHKRACQTPIPIEPESKTVTSKAHTLVFVAVLGTICHWVIKFGIFVNYFYFPRQNASY